MITISDDRSHDEMDDTNEILPSENGLGEIAGEVAQVLRGKRSRTQYTLSKKIETIHLVELRRTAGFKNATALVYLI
jgi:hypothetical protein